MRRRRSIGKAVRIAMGRDMQELGFGDGGREARLWSDAFTGNDFQAEQYSIQYWMGNPGNVKYQAALGHKIICSDTAAYYMDYPYAADDRAGSRVSAEDRAGRGENQPGGGSSKPREGCRAAGAVHIPSI